MNYKTTALWTKLILEIEMANGTALFDLAKTRLGQKYVNVCVPKDNPDWQGPWDCAEFASWLVYQTTQRLYGCTNNKGNPATVEAYTGAWQHDAQTLGRKVTVAEAANTKGAFILRFPPAPGAMGHIVVSDGKGGTVEAMGKLYGVRQGKVAGRVWDTGVLVPWMSYDAAGTVPLVEKPMIVYGQNRPGMDPGIIRRIQTRLQALGYSVGSIDGEFGSWTTAAVAAFQRSAGLVVDGQVGPQTAGKMRIDLA